ncbi:MAG: acetyl-CoA carboxylase carboxyltransferase subunit alpha [Endomicrobiales bacterium]|nr:acetyl-CoA carboxylase carboxyltransferase subunit alpha [Endomicrobiales bacterium]
MSNEITALEFEKPITDIENRISELKNSGNDKSEEVRILEKKCEKLKTDIYGSLSSWQRVQLARHPKRPYTSDYISLIFTDFVELHGDRAYSDDKALVCGLAMLGSIPVVIVGQQKGRNIKENMERNFGMMHPEGYRKALRIMKLAEKFNHPVVTFIDTPGAYPGIGAEERGQAEAIARNLREMAGLKIPVVSVIIGEGGSGGALGIGVSNKLLMLENAYYSVITPEGCAAILFRDAARAPEASEALKITAQDLYKLGIIDEIIPEPLGGAHRDVQSTAKNIKNSLTKNISALNKMSKSQLEEERYKKYRNIGVFTEERRSGSERRSISKTDRRKNKVV